MKKLHHSKKQKIRGWKRRKRSIQLWRQQMLELDMETVRSEDFDYAKLWIYPFYSISPIDPPHWFQRLLLGEMIDVYAHWQKQMEQEGEPFYLKIWLYEPNFILSQIVVAYRSRLHFYDEHFQPAPTARPFPFADTGALAEKLSKLDWQLCIQEELYWSNELQDNIDKGLRTKAEVKRLIDRAYATETMQYGGEEQTVYKVQIGDVWLGTWKTD
ncbi:hypothetical protein [Paenibacillus hunanensis]|uniref:DUF3841 domain-containing protein n=1 Tax=Paenibacillus hunanensis TaxID=539262 RepID=A0ABU1J0P8_9BACL|nr:hypothetical protein [Paenibacillus hunanensis]MDR6245046.1 hypothetical protein [Paenibacillus hunanensis]GGI96347.1 hypothetical protein GCM10008022_00990 [Paenibacillus hunanensis]